MSASRRVKKVIPPGVYRGYMPIDLPQHRPPRRIKPWWKVLGKPRVTLYPKPEIEGFSEEPEYPELNDASKEGLKRQVRLDWYESLRALPTVEQKLHEMNRHGAVRMAHFNNWLPSSCSLPFAQYLTQTHVIDSLPDSYQVPSKSIQDVTQPGSPILNGSVETQDEHSLIKRIKQIVLEQIVIEKYESGKIRRYPYVSKSIRDGNKRAHVSNTMIQNIFNNVKKTLVCGTNPQLLEYQIDLSPAIRSWWFHSGFEPPTNQVFYRSRKDQDGHINTFIQMDGSSALNVRGEHLIEPVLNLDDSLVTDLSLIRKTNFNPKHYGAFYKFKYPVTLPGFWFEEKPRYDFPHTCFLSTDCLELRQNKPYNLAVSLEDDNENCLTTQAIMTAFGWLNSLSMYHGHTPFDELNYPFTCQVITTDGQNWLFNVYQLNTHTFHRDRGGPQRNNICWSSGLMKLYETYESGTFKGINEDVLRIMTNFLSKQTSPHYTKQLNLRPYLGVDTRTQEERDEMARKLRATFEGRKNQYLSVDWAIPEYEHIFFRAKEMRYQIRTMKPKWHIPKPPIPKVYE